MIRDFLQIIPTRALERVRPSWQSEGQHDLTDRLKARRERRKVYSEAQR